MSIAFPNDVVVPLSDDYIGSNTRIIQGAADGVLYDYCDVITYTPSAYSANVFKCDMTATSTATKYPQTYHFYGSIRHNGSTVHRIYNINSFQYYEYNTSFNIYLLVSGSSIIFRGYSENAAKWSATLLVVETKR